MENIEKFVSRYNSRNTQKTYRSHLTNFFIYINQDPNKYFDKKHDYKKDIEKYWKDILIDSPPLTRHAALSCIRTYLMRNDIEIKPLMFWKDLKATKAGKRAVTKSEVPTPSELREILEFADIKGRAFFLFLSSTGTRVFEALSITEDDIDFNYKVNGQTLTKIDLPAEITKTKETRSTFCTSECTQAMLAWKKVRSEYLISAGKKCNFPNNKCFKHLDDNTFFCFSYGTVRTMWYRLLKNSGFEHRDRNTKRKWRTMHIHVLRKYFRHNLSHKAGRDCAELLMGHVDSLGNVYRDYPDKDLAAMYLKGIPDISVFEAAPDLSGVHEELTDVRDENKRLLSKLEMMDTRMQLLEMQRDQERMKREMRSR